MHLHIYDSSDPRWPALLVGTNHDIYHLPSYVRAEDQVRNSTTRLYVVSDKEISLVVPISLREIHGTAGLWDASSPYGYPGPLASHTANDEWIEAAIDVLLAGLSEIGVVSLFLRFHTLIGVAPARFASVGTTVSHGSTVSIALNKSHEEIRAGMRSGHRYDIRRALRDGQVAECDLSWSHFDAFIAIYEESMDRVGATNSYYFPRSYFESLRDNLGHHVFLWVTKIDNDVAAASLITKCDGIMQYHLSGTRQEFLRQYPTKVLLDGAAEWGMENGASRFHLGGGVGGDEDTLFHFKAGFSKDRHTFSTARIIVNPDEYLRLSSQWEANSGLRPTGAEGYFPAYLRTI